MVQSRLGLSWDIWCRNVSACEGVEGVFTRRVQAESQSSRGAETHPGVVELVLLEQRLFGRQLVLPVVMRPFQ